jgi:hypothetical protein
MSDILHSGKFENHEVNPQWVRVYEVPNQPATYRPGEMAFKRQTLVYYRHARLLVSTVGLMRGNGGVNDATYVPIGYDRYYETLVFADYGSGYNQIEDLGLPWAVASVDKNSNYKAIANHSRMLDELVKRLEAGEYQPENEGNTDER